MLCLCTGSGSDKHNVISLQVDYESEEENEEENANGNLEDEEAESEKEGGTPGAEEDQNRAEGEDSQHLPFMSQPKKGKDRLLQSAEVRVSAVVESHPSIQDYTFDTKNELWCEVRWNISGWLHVAPIKNGSFQCSAAVLSQQYHMNTESGTASVFFMSFLVIFHFQNTSCNFF